MPEARVPIQSQRPGGALDLHFAHGAAPVLGNVVGQTVAVEKATRAVGEFELQDPGILARDRGVQTAQIGRDRRDFSDQETERVDPVYRGLAD